MNIDGGGGVSGGGGGGGGATLAGADAPRPPRARNDRPRRAIPIHTDEKIAD